MANLQTHSVRVDSLRETELFQGLPSYSRTVEKIEGKFTECLYLSVVVRGDDELKRARFVEMLDRLISDGFIIGRLCNPISLPLADDGKGSRVTYLAYVFCDRTRARMNEVFGGQEFFVEEGSLGPEAWPLEVINPS